MIKHGFVSRRRTCKRPIDVDTMRAIMKRHLHCFRAVALQPELELGPALPDGFFDATTTDLDFVAPDDGTARLEAPHPVATFKYKVRANVNKALAEEVKAKPVMKKKYGHYGLAQRIHIDQIPFYFDQNPRRSYCSKETAGMNIVSGQPGADKRFGTIQLAMHGCPKTARISIPNNKKVKKRVKMEKAARGKM